MESVFRYYLLMMGHGVQWTVLRVDGLTNGAEGPVKTTYPGNREDGLWISRDSGELGIGRGGSG